MSGGSMEYLYGKLEDNICYLKDPVIKAMALDFVDVLHDAEWAEDADILDEDYFETLERFKKKWLKKRTLTKREAAKVDRIKPPYEGSDEDEDECRA